MKAFIHLFLSNLKYNKIELGISYSITAVVLILFNIFRNPKNSEADFLFSIAFYAMLYAFYTNRRKFNLKYLLSLPLSKSQLIMTKVTSDFVYFVPSIVLAFSGVMFSKQQFSAIPLLFILLQIITFVAFIIFDSDVEQPRLENAKSSFMNRLIYVRKGMDLVFFGVFILYFALAVNMTPLDMAIKQYLIIIILFLALGFKFRRTLNLLKDESLSYFIPRRDMWIIGKKVMVFGTFGALFMLSGATLPSKYGKSKIYSLIENNKVEEFKKIISKIDKDERSEKGFTPVSAALMSGKLDLLKLLLQQDFELNKATVKFESKESYRPVHLAASSGNTETLDFIIGKNLKGLDRQTTKYKYTPLHIASIDCNPNITDYLISKKANLNLKDSEGNTALTYAAMKRCFSSMALLLEAGANPLIKNAEDKIASSYVKGSSKYLLERKERLINSQVSRGLASEKK